MRNRRSVTILVFSGVATLVTAGTTWAEQDRHDMPKVSPGEQAMMEAIERASTPGSQHATLAAMAGDWTFEGTFWGAPDQPPMTTTGTATRTMILGGRVLVEKVTSHFMGQTFEGQGMTGYDNAAGSYWSTWIDNMSTGLMTSTGSCNQGRCEWRATGTDPMTGKTSRMRITSEHGPDSEQHRSYETGEGGEERLTMELKYKRAR